jgi:hypothetical protein
MRSTACWSLDARSLSASPDAEQGWGECACTPGPCNTPSPGFSSAFSISGYHFHFLSNDRLHGGHLLDVEAGPLRLRVEALTDFHLALPESEAFLKADLSKNTAGELAYAEQAH